MSLTETQQALSDASDTDVSTRSVLVLNCTLKPLPEPSHTRPLIDVIAAVMEKNDVNIEIPWPVDHNLAPGVYGDEREDRSRVGFDNDFIQRNTTVMTWNRMHTALHLHEADCRFAPPNPEHRRAPLDSAPARDARSSYARVGTPLSMYRVSRAITY